MSSRWTLIGCGSVGSKIGLHMARAGRGPSPRESLRAVLLEPVLNADPNAFYTNGDDAALQQRYREVASGLSANDRAEAKRALVR